MKNIKSAYKIALSVLGLLLLMLELIILVQTDGDKKWDRMIQIAAPFVALASGVIAVANSDKKQKVIKAEITSKIISGGSQAVYKASDIHWQLRERLEKQKPFYYSYQVTFIIKNISGFSLKKPTISFRLPFSLRHPDPADKPQVLTFNSNIFNSQQELQTLEFQDAQVISNSNLPYLNDLDEINIWIRMCLDKDEDRVFRIIVYVNAEDVEGISRVIELNPRKLLA